MEAGCSCPPVRNDVVTLHHLSKGFVKIHGGHLKVACGRQLKTKRQDVKQLKTKKKTIRVTDGQIDGQTNRPTDQQTDRVAHRVACTLLKIIKETRLVLSET